MPFNLKDRSNFDFAYYATQNPDVVNADQFTDLDGEDWLWYHWCVCERKIENIDSFHKHAPVRHRSHQEMIQISTLEELRVLQEPLELLVLLELLELPELPEPLVLQVPMVT